MEEMHRGRDGGGARCFHVLLSRCHSPQISMCLCAQKPYKPHPFGLLWKLYYLGMID